MPGHCDAMLQRAMQRWLSARRTLAGRESRTSGICQRQLMRVHSEASMPTLPRLLLLLRLLLLHTDWHWDTGAMQSGKNSRAKLTLLPGIWTEHTKRLA